ncbi:MAG: SDR family oxidoreductase [Rhizobiales bacterium]|nr:SDR family oxidoreductase [Hyphomicrobiales bacterium]MBI3671850.1 SDR family oxidoreductase [Hyphomicrobiales bacterium]
MSPVTPASQLFGLTGEVALVTGASSGLGARFAEVLAAHGARVVLAARRADRIAALAKGLSGAMALVLDVTKPETFPAAFDAAEREFGPVTLLVNNAGVANDGKFLDTDPERWDNTIATNVSAVWHLSREFARRLVGLKRPGAIVNVSSVLGCRVTPGAGAYCVSKAAVAQMTAAMAVELARHGIRVNAIAPGYIWSEMTEAYLKSEGGLATIKRIPQRRAGDPSDLDGALLLLASRKAAGFMTGSTVTVDGGHVWSFN